jgi:hypothetical protein
MDKKSPIQFDKGIGQMREWKFETALVEDLRYSSDLARTNRLIGVFSRYPENKLKEFMGFIDLELSAFEGKYFSESNIKRLFPSIMLFAVALATAWSAFAGRFLGLDLLNSLWGSIGSFISSKLGFWSTFLGWVFFIFGLIFIAAWAAGRYLILNQRHKLARIKLGLKLYLQAVESVRFKHENTTTNQEMPDHPR